MVTLPFFYFNLASNKSGNEHERITNSNQSDASMTHSKYGDQGFYLDEKNSK